MASSGYTSIFRDDTNKYSNLLDNVAISPSSITTSQISFGQSALSYYKITTGLALIMTDGTNNYTQNFGIQRVGNVVNLTLRSASSSVNAVSIVYSTAGLPAEYRPANASSMVIYATYPGGASLPALRLTITTGGLLQIRKLDATAFSGVGTLAYDEQTISYSVV